MIGREESQRSRSSIAESVQHMLFTSRRIEFWLFVGVGPMVLKHSPSAMWGNLGSRIGHDSLTRDP
jgi:hypothetical protein